MMSWAQRGGGSARGGTAARILAHRRQTLGGSLPLALRTRAHKMETLVLRTSNIAAFQVLAPYERKGFELVGLKSRDGGTTIALRASPAAVAAGDL